MQRSVDRAMRMIEQERQRIHAAQETCMPSSARTCDVRANVRCLRMRPGSGAARISPMARGDVRAFLSQRDAKRDTPYG